MPVSRTPSRIRSRRRIAAGALPVVMIALLALPVIACGEDSPSPTDPGGEPTTDPRPGSGEDPEGMPADGTIYVEAVTSGARLDPDGYVVSVDGTVGPAIGRSGSTSISGFATGEHSVSLSGVASNCQVTVPNPQTVAVGDPFGSPVASFYIYCE